METDPHRTVRPVRMATLVVFVALTAAAIVLLAAAARMAGKRVNVQTRNAFKAGLKDADRVRITIPGSKAVFESNDVNVVGELSDNIKLCDTGRTIAGRVEGT